MSKSFTALTSYPFKTGAGIARPTQELPKNVTLNDPAINVMTDLRFVSVIVVRAMTTLDRANDKMIRYGVRTLLVLDEKDKVTGILTANDVLGEKPVSFLQQMGGTHADILVRDVMTLQRDLEVFKLEDILKSKVGNVLAALKLAKRQHGMVAEVNADGSQTVRGLFSATQIARQMGMQVDAASVAKVFDEIDATAAAH